MNHAVRYSPSELYNLTKTVAESKHHFHGVTCSVVTTDDHVDSLESLLVLSIVAAAGFKSPYISSQSEFDTSAITVMRILSPVSFPPEGVHDIISSAGMCAVIENQLKKDQLDNNLHRVEESLRMHGVDKSIVDLMAHALLSGANHVIFNIVYGEDTHIKNRRSAESLGRTLTQMERQFSVKVATYINQYSGPLVPVSGSYLSAVEVLRVLEQDDNRSQDLEKKALTLAGKLLDLCYKTTEAEKNGLEEAERLLSNGSAKRKFMQMVKAQGGNPYITAKTLALKTHSEEILTDKEGLVSSIRTKNLEAITKILGGPSDVFAGVQMHKKIKDKVGKGEPIMSLYSSNKYNLKEAVETVKHFPIFNIE